MAGHPARQLARMAADAAGELRGYTDPADPFPWELTEDDHRAILPRLHRRSRTWPSASTASPRPQATSTRNSSSPRASAGC